MPAAAVIPALRAYIKVVAFKTPVVEIAWSRCPTRGGQEEKRREKGEKERCNTTHAHLRFERKSRGGGGKRKRVHLF